MPLKRLASIVVLAAAAAPLPAGPGEDLKLRDHHWVCETYVRRDDPLDTLLDSLDASLSVPVRASSWLAIGPLDNTDGNVWKATLAPERGFDPDATCRGPNGEPVGWSADVRIPDGRRTGLWWDHQAPTAGYFYRRIASDRPREVLLGVQAEETTRIWLNGEALPAAPEGGYRSDRPISLSLRKGVNHLLVKACSPDRAVRIGLITGGPLRDQVRRRLIERLRAETTEAEFADVMRRLTRREHWLKWDGLDGPGADFRQATGRALDLASRTLAMVQAERAVPRLAADLARLRTAIPTGDDARADWRKLYLAVRSLRRRIVLAHPLLDFERLLIVKRPPPGYSHMCDQYLGRHSGAGDGLVAITDWKGEPVAEAILDGKLPVGSVLHPDLSYDGRRVVFSFCDHTESDRKRRVFRLWEASADGSWVRQVTGGADDPLQGAHGRETVRIEDFDACYLPDGGIAFISTRNQGFGRCHGGRYTPSYVLYRLDGNAANITRLSFGEANEWDPAVLHDGRIVYTRWDYINRHDTIFQSLWTTRPDGTNVRHYYGNYTRNPCMVAEAKAIPGSDRVVATAMAHHSYTAGSLILIDPTQGEDGPEPIERLTPESSFPETEGWPDGAYANPWPLSEDLVLASYMPDRLQRQGRHNRDNAWGIVLVDSLGGRELIYRDPNTSCFSPIPLQPRRPARRLASSLPPDAPPEGALRIQDVYHAREDLPRGSIRSIRVVAIHEQPSRWPSRRSRANNEIVKSILGTSPVAEDGSAAFLAPAGVPLLLQCLDANGMSLMSMRSQIYLQPGEETSCVGCHEPRDASPRMSTPKIVAPSPLTPPPGPSYEGGLHFARTVQPVLDRHCIGCHGLDQGPKKTAVTLLGTPTKYFTVSYEHLTDPKSDRIVLAQRNRETYLSKTKDYGSHAGSLGPMLARGHQGLKLPPHHLRRIAGWLDLNAQFRGDYSRDTGLGRIVPEAMARLREAIRERFGDELAAQPDAALVNLADPDLSRILLAPLATDAGGWGQISPEWTSRDDESFERFRTRVRAAVE